MPKSTRGARASRVVVSALLLGGCWSASDERRDDPRPVERIVLFPLNAVPDIVVDTGSLLLLPLFALPADEASSAWPLYWLGTPILGPFWGLSDAGHGRPFWRTTGPETIERLTTSPEPPAVSSDSQEDAP